MLHILVTIIIIALLFNLPMFSIPLVFFLIGFNTFQRKRFIENLPTSKIRAAAMGWVEIQGKTTSQVVLQSPFSKTPCAHAVICLSEMGRYPRWLPHPTPLLIYDDTGVASIHPPIFPPTVYRTQTVKLLQKPTELPEHFLEFLKVSNVNSQALRYPISLEERCVAFDTSLCLMGIAQTPSALPLPLPQPRIEIVPGEPPGFILKRITAIFKNLFPNRPALRGFKGTLWLEADDESRVVGRLALISTSCFVAGCLFTGFFAFKFLARGLP